MLYYIFSEIPFRSLSISLRRSFFPFFLQFSCRINPWLSRFQKVHNVIQMPNIATASMIRCARQLSSFGNFYHNFVFPRLLYRFFFASLIYSPCSYFNFWNWCNFSTIIMTWCTTLIKWIHLYFWFILCFFCF